MLSASRLRNQIPGRPPNVTYVRTFSSGKRERTGGGSVPRARVPCTSNGVTDSQAAPSNVSSGRLAGTCGASWRTPTLRWQKSRSTHVWPITHGASGSGPGRWSTATSDARWRRAAPGRAATTASAPSAIRGRQAIGGRQYPGGPESARRLRGARAQRPAMEADGDLTRHRAARGEPLLLLHGLGLTWQCWTPVLPALEAGHEVVAIDLPGFGTAPEIDGGRRPTVGALADAVEAELDRLGLDTPDIAGNSLGGWIALELARRGRARRVVAIAPAGLEAPPERAYLVSVNEWMRLRAKAVAPVADLATRHRFTRAAALGALRGRPWRVPAGEAADEVRAFARAPAFQATLRWTVAAQPALGLLAVGVPVRVCVGTRDTMLGVFTAPRLAAALPDPERRRLPGCGQVPMPDAPPLVAGAILAR